MPPNPDNPNDTVPDVMPFDIPYGETINIETAKKVAAAAVAEAKKRILEDVRLGRRPLG